MKAGWKRVKLGDVGRIVGGATPSTREASNYGGDISWISPKDLSGYADRYIEHGERNITQVGFDSCSTEMLPKGSVLFSSRAPIGYVAIAANELCTNQGFKSLIPDSSIIDGLFAYYLLVFNKDRIEALGSGTTFKEVSASVMRQVDVVLPPLPTQRRIAAVLGALDDKIELNRKMNANLEAQAQALFKSWFVDFAPWGGKMPKEWKMGSLLDIADYTNGLAMQKYRPKGGDLGLPVLKIKELHQGCVDDASERCQSNLPDSVVVNDGDVVFSWSGTLLVELWCGGKVGLNQHLFKVTSDKYDKWFYFMWTKHHNERFAAIAKAFATTMGHIKRGELQKAEVIIPDRETISSMTKKIKPLIDLIIQNNVESRKLAETRDALLPKLMSGEVEA